MILVLAIAFAATCPQPQAIQQKPTRRAAIENLQKLKEQLLSDAENEIPPFGAESVRMACHAGPAAAPLLLSEIRAENSTSLLALESLRAADPNAWDSLAPEMRAHIYAEALHRSVFFNAWGVPGYQLSDTSQAFASLGGAAVSALRPLLDDRREAALSGSQDATTSRSYGNRICDYAWILTCHALHRACSYFRDPGERDQAIAALRRDFDAGAGPQ